MFKCNNVHYNLKTQETKKEEKNEKKNNNLYHFFN
jgi:hypothetical protein